MCVMIGQDKYPDVQGSSRKMTKKNAACVTLNKLRLNGGLAELFPEGAVSTGHP